MDAGARVPYLSLPCARLKVSRIGQRHARPKAAAAVAAAAQEEKENDSVRGTPAPTTKAIVRHSAWASLKEAQVPANLEGSTRAAKMGTSFRPSPADLMRKRILGRKIDVL